MFTPWNLFSIPLGRSLFHRGRSLFNWGASSQSGERKNTILTEKLFNEFNGELYTYDEKRYEKNKKAYLS